jgi:hypothetical protein
MIRRLFSYFFRRHYDTSYLYLSARCKAVDAWTTLRDCEHYHMTLDQYLLKHHGVLRRRLSMKDALFAYHVINLAIATTWRPNHPLLPTSNPPAANHQPHESIFPEGPTC